VLTQYEWDDGSGRAVPRAFGDLGAELLVPVRRGDTLEYVVALGGKESGRAYNVNDAVVLQTIAGQLSLAMATARAFEELAALNASLEQQVADRTAELAKANQDLSGFLAELNDAYHRLEQSQKSLLRADRLATLGKLAAGIAHEINTPLAALMNSLDVLGGLGREYDDSIADPNVSAADHREIAREIRQTVETAETWASRAATYIGRIKSHGHEPSANDVRAFTVGEALDEVSALLDHRLRASGCRIDHDAETRATGLVGDQAQLIHLLLNLVDNAIGAYEDVVDPDGRIEVRARLEGGAVVLTVRDHATGVPPAIAGRIFDELFTTKERGKGTGLGLWIARNIAERSFGGTLELVAVDGPGACFRTHLLSSPDPASARGRSSSALAPQPDMESA
jgi:C4-dicarboxylate-specific signal transduction histidine kinase